MTKTSRMDMSRSDAGTIDMPQIAMNRFDPEQRRAGIRRTVWIVGGIAAAIFVLFFLKQGIWH